VLDINGIEQKVVATLTGITPVVIVGTVIAVNRAYNNNGIPFVGDISIKGSVSGNTFAYIDAREQQTTQCIYMVPSNKYAVVRNMSSSMNRGGNSDNVSIVKFVVQLLGKVWRTQVRYGLQQRGTSNISSDLVIPAVYPPLTRLKVVFTPDSNQDVSAELSIQLVDATIIDSVRV
jgi:hypothetical protein